MKRSGKYYHPIEYRAFGQIKTRCNNPKSPAYAHYGGCGIKCMFKDFKEFFEEVGPRPTKNHSIDRYPNTSGHYTKGNLRWATKLEQTLNRTSTVNILVGDRMLCLKYACAALGLHISRVKYVQKTQAISAQEAIDYCLVNPSQRDSLLSAQEWTLPYQQEILCRK